MESNSPKPLSKRAGFAVAFVLAGGLALWVIAAVVAIVFLPGCTSTVRPKTLTDSTPSPDGGAMNSGLVGWFTNASGGVSMVITPHARDRYNAMIPIYGTNFLPAPKIDEGISTFTNGTFLIDDEHLFKMIKMNRARKGG